MRYRLDILPDRATRDGFERGGTYDGEDATADPYDPRRRWVRLYRTDPRTKDLRSIVVDAAWVQAVSDDER